LHQYKSRIQPSMKLRRVDYLEKYIPSQAGEVRAIVGYKEVEGTGEGKKAIRTKGYLIFRTLTYSEEEPRGGCELYSHGYHYHTLCEIKLVRKTLEDNGFTNVPYQKDWSVMWSVSNYKSSVFQNLHKYQKVNHFPRSYELTRKDSLYQ
jgi:hypothetical protein